MSKDVRIKKLLVAASESGAIGSHGDGLPVNAMVEAGDADFFILRP